MEKGRYRWWGKRVPVIFKYLNEYHVEEEEICSTKHRGRWRKWGHDGVPHSVFVRGQPVRALPWVPSPTDSRPSQRSKDQGEKPNSISTEMS